MLRTKHGPKQTIGRQGTRGSAAERTRILFWSNWNHLEHLGPLRTTLDHLRLFRIIWNSLEQFRTLWEYIGQFKTI